MTLGCGGHRLSDVNHDQPEWLAKTYAKFGYGRVTVDDGYSLTFEFVRTDVSFCSVIFSPPSPKTTATCSPSSLRAPTCVLLLILFPEFPFATSALDAHAQTLDVSCIFGAGVTAPDGCFSCLRVLQSRCYAHKLQLGGGHLLGFEAA